MSKPITFEADVNGCLVCTSHSLSGGYPARWSAGRLQPVARLVYVERHGPLPDGQVVARTCGNPLCINGDHLAAVPAVAVAAANGRRAAGEANGRAKLTEADVRDIRASALSRKQLARKFKVDFSVVDGILKRELWKCVA